MLTNARFGGLFLCPHFVANHFMIVLVMMMWHDHDDADEAKGSLFRLFRFVPS